MHFQPGFNADVNNVVHKTRKHWKSRKTDLFRNLKMCVFRKITTDFENHLKHQVSITLCAFLDFDLLVHILLSNVSPFCATGNFHPLRTLLVSARKLKFQ